jgi:hypothetical protein
MGRTLRGVISSLLVGSLVIGLAGPAGAALTDQERAEHATGFIASQQKASGSFPAFSAIGSTADAVLAFVAAGVGRRETRDALGYLKAQVEKGNVELEGQRAKVLLAWTSAGRGGRTIGGVNLVRELRAGWNDGLTHAVYDTALTILALRSAAATVPAPAIAFLVSEQCDDGGWPYDRRRSGDDEHCQNRPRDYFLSDTNTTALAVMALQATVPTRATALIGTSPWTFFESLRDETHGGWGYTWGYETTDANSTGLVLQAYAAAGLATPPGARKALRHLQYGRCGAFAFTWDGAAKGAPDLGATIGAVPGLLRKPFPYTGTIEGPAPRLPACPG